MSLQPKQFGDWNPSGAETQTSWDQRHYGSSYSSKDREGTQGRLLPLGTVPEKQPHQMQPLEFAEARGTLWHGSQATDFEDLRRAHRASERIAVGEPVYDGPKIPRPMAEDIVDKGFHVGTLSAAMDRRAEVVHPGRIEPTVQTGITTDKGNNWLPEDHDNWYVNEYEDQGSESAILRSPQRDRFVHYGDYVREAMDTPGKIPSGQAEHWLATQAQRHGAERPGFRLDEYQVQHRQVTKDDVGKAVPRLEPRPDAHLGPVDRAHRAMGVGQPRNTQGRMLDTINNERREEFVLPEDLRYKR